MNLSRLRLITFDVTDTLLKFRSGPGKQYGEIGAMYGLLANDDALAVSFKSHWTVMSKDHPNFGLKTGIGWENWWRAVVRGTFKDANFPSDDKTLDAISSHLIELYKTSTCWQQCYGATGLLTYLKDKGFTLGVISNFDPRLTTILENCKLHSYFNFVTTSYEVGVEKPDKKIFEEAAKASNLSSLKGEQCLHLGDNPTKDYIAAKEAGWNALLVTDRSPNNLKEKYLHIDPNHVFSSLYDIHRFFLDQSDEVRKENVI